MIAAAGLVSIGLGVVSLTAPGSVWFERGQHPLHETWVLRARSGSATLDGDELRLSLAWGGRLVLRFAGARPDLRGEPLAPRAGRSHYFLGNDPACWVTGVPHWGGVRFAEVWPGIDVVHHARSGQLEQDFVLAPGARSDRIRIQVTGGSLASEGGDVVVTSAEGELRWRAPRAFQATEGGPRAVAVRFRELGAGGVGFALGEYDRALALVIDPVVSFSSYLGGAAGDEALDVAVDAAGNAYVAGVTSSPDFPLVDPFQSTWPGAPSMAFLTKIDPRGPSIVYSTFFGGTLGQGAFAVAVDFAQQPVVAGNTSAFDFPVFNAFQPRLGEFGCCAPDCGDAFVTKFSADGSSLVFSTYFGGVCFDRAQSMDIDAAGAVVIAGMTDSANLPVLNAYQGTHGGGRDGFVAGFTPDGALRFSSFLGASEDDRLLDVEFDERDGSVALAGVTTSPGFPTIAAAQGGFGGVADAVVARLSGDGTRLLSSSFLGGTDRDEAWGVAVDGQGRLSIAGRTYSPDFPLLGALQAGKLGASDAFVAQLTAAGDVFLFSTYLGGSGVDMARDVVAASDGELTLGGYTESFDFPTRTAWQREKLRARSEGFITSIDPATPELLCSTFLGGTNDDWVVRLALESRRRYWVAGYTQAPDFPLASPVRASYGGGSSDGFVARYGCEAAAGAIGNSLRVAHSPVGGFLVFAALDDADASEHRVYRDSAKGGSFPLFFGAARSAASSFLLPEPADPRVFFRLAAANCCGEGPR